MPEIVARAVEEAAFASLLAGGCDPRLARIFAARGIVSHDELATTLKALAAPEGLAHVDDAARILAEAIAAGERILIVADYDADGATACAVGVRALRAFGAHVITSCRTASSTATGSRRRSRARRRSARPASSSPWTTASRRSRASRKPIASACASS